MIDIADISLDCKLSFCEVFSFRNTIETKILTSINEKVQMGMSCCI